MADADSALAAAHEVTLDANASAPGRLCPISYRYAPTVFRREPDVDTDVLYVVGGLYGNTYALDALHDRVARETLPTRIVFNGDFHWFDIDANDFARINRTVLADHALRGNVETELASAAAAAGCGCGYPDWVSDADVARSNSIIEQLRDSAAADVAALRSLAALPMHIVARVGDVRVGIVHGDCWSLAGWGFAQETLESNRKLVQAGFHEADVDVFASSHTCLPVACKLAGPDRARVLVNNGAAGMPNFAGTHFGLVTRIAQAPAADALYRATIASVVIEALPLHYDHVSWVRHFGGSWPPGSAASDSYRRRITEGPNYCVDQALRAGFTLVT
jgi:hypothetical protein